jgi:radical SAM superfamily enzyme YgiQ (UPF0313 family)
MRVLLLRPNSIILATPVPIGMGYIAGALRKSRNDEVKIIDARNERFSISEMRQRIREFNPDVIGLSALNFEMPETHLLAEAAKAEAPKAPVIIGGPYAAANRKSILEDKNINYVVYGEGEDTIVELMDAIESHADLSTVKGIIYRDKKEIIENGPRELIDDLDSLEVAWDLLDPPSYFKRFGRNSENIVKHDHRTMNIFTSRGCPYGCIFCHNVFGKKFRPRSPESVIDEIKLLQERYDVRELEIVDDSFNQSVKRAKLICEGIVEDNLKLHIALPNGIRGDKTDSDLLDLFQASGFYRIAFAVESASPRLQKIINKTIDLDKVKWSIEEVARRGMVASGYFIQGFPTETYDEMLLTGDWAAASDVHVASFFYLNPFPGTEVAKMAGEKFTNINFRDYSTMSVNISDATDAELHEANKYAYRKFYLSPKRFVNIVKVVPKNLRTVLNAWLVFRLLFQDSVNQ